MGLHQNIHFDTAPLKNYYAPHKHGEKSWKQIFRKGYIAPS